MQCFQLNANSLPSIVFGVENEKCLDVISQPRVGNHSALLLTQYPIYPLSVSLSPFAICEINQYGLRFNRER